MRMSRTSLRRAVIALAAGALVLLAASFGMPAAASNEYRAQFQRTVGLYAGSDVTVLGVRVGKVLEVEPQGEVVEVTFKVPSDVRIPASAQAVLVAPTLVSDRRLELTPPYSGGPALEPGSLVPLQRTVVPVEIDQVLESVRELSAALGPKGANSDGALDQLVRAGADTMRGNGADLNTAVTELSGALATADKGSQDLAGTLTNLATLTRALAGADRPVRQLSRVLAAVARSLATQRGALVGTVEGLGVAMREIRRLVKDSGPALTGNVAGLLDVTRTVLKQEQALRETLNLAPVALENFIGTFDPQTSALSARVAVNGTLTSDPSLVQCQLIASNGLGSYCPALHRALDPIEPALQGLPQPLGEGQEFSEFTPVIPRGGGR